MDKITKMLHKARQILKEEQSKNYIFQALLFTAAGGKWELTIVYTDNKPNDKFIFNTHKEAVDFAYKLAEEHGQEDLTLISWKPRAGEEEEERI